jgi:hypothetical protein
LSRRALRRRRLESDLARRVDLALVMVEALEGELLAHEAPGDRRPPDPSALARAADA